MAKRTRKTHQKFAVPQILSICCFILFFCNSNLSAYEDENEDEELSLGELVELSLDDLFNLKVPTVSQKAEKISHAPGIVSIVTQDQMKRFGARNLRDVLDRVTNTQVIGSHVFPHNVTAIRAGAKTHADNHILLLLNGRPIREAHGGGINGDIYRSFPIETIERLEIIRGPGSVLYGTNAFTGVINVITKKASKDPGLIVSTRYGSFDTKQVTVSGGKENGDFSFYGGIDYLDSQGWDFEATDEAGVHNIIKNEETGTQAVFQASYKGLTVNSILSNTSKRNIGPAFIFPGGIWGLNRQFIDVGYTHAVTENWDVAVNSTYNGQSFDFPIGGIKREFDSSVATFPRRC